MSLINVRPTLVGALDEGTSSVRFMVFEAGTPKVVASHQIELNKFFPKEGWVEQDPLEIMKLVSECIDVVAQKLAELGRNANEIIAVGISNQRESTIVWDKTTGKPLYNSIVWLDMRTSTTLEQLLDKVPNKTRNKNYLRPLCGLPMSPYFSALKLKWLKDNVPNVNKAIAEERCLFGTVDSWLIWNLTGGKDGGVHVTDVTNASRTMLMNIDSLLWDPVLLDFFETPIKMLPTILSSSEVYGHIHGGPLDGVPIASCLGDQQAALVGQMCFTKGTAKATYGTGCFLLYNTGRTKILSSRGLLTTVAYQMGSSAPATYALEGSVGVAGAALSWLRDNIGILPRYDRTASLANEADRDQSGSVVFVPAFSGLYAPYWAQEARGVICGITETTKASHIIKAALEAVCFQTRDILDTMNKDYGTKLKKLQVDGGMTSNILLMQLQADLAGIVIEKPHLAETSALGAAMAAGRAMGVWNIHTTDDYTVKIDNNKEEAAQVWTPQYTDDERDVCYAKWKMAIERAMGWDIELKIND